MWRRTASRSNNLQNGGPENVGQLFTRITLNAQDNAGLKLNEYKKGISIRFGAGKFIAVATEGAYSPWGCDDDRAIPKGHQAWGWQVHVTVEAIGARYNLGKGGRSYGSPTSAESDVHGSASVFEVPSGGSNVWFWLYLISGQEQLTPESSSS